MYALLLIAALALLSVVLIALVTAVRLVGLVGEARHHRGGGATFPPHMEPEKSRAH